MLYINVRDANMLNYIKKSKSLKISMIIFLSIIITIIMSISINHFIIKFEEYECSGVGGFVYKEFNWAQQTYNVVSHCQNLDGMNVPVLYYNDDVHKFYCLKTTDCTVDGCRYKTEYLDPIIIKE